MNQVSLTLKVFFEDPFWVGMMERREDQQLSVSKIIFGQEPQDWQCYQLVMTQYHHLTFSPVVAQAVFKRKVNPKRRQRQIHREVSSLRLSTQSQLAYQKQRELMKKLSLQKFHQQKALLKEEKYFLKQQKRKKKHRGH